MLLKVPMALSHPDVRCDVRGFSLQPGNTIGPGDHLAELRYEVIDDKFSDCPVVQYGDLIAQASGVVRSVEDHRSGPMGMVLAEIGDEPGDFPVSFETL
jgi:hypothetical protein